MDKEIIEINSKQAYPAASLIKVPILIEAFRQKEEGKLDVEQLVSISKEEKVGGAGVLFSLSSKASFTIHDLMTLMIIVSDNTATNQLIDLIGWHEINQCIKALNLTSTRLNRKMMDLDAIKLGKDNWTSAVNIGTCLKEIYKGSLLSKESKEEILSMMRKQQFKEKLPAYMNLEKGWIANKTGELEGIEHDCAIIQYNGITVYMAVLIDQLSAQEDGRETIRQIGKLVNNYLVNTY
ncbi:serine hydrolase [Bacillus sp. 03113]|uniref:serine hydrolase n=1 Tax=Bacillus sp. 03113 TaxID=2578211 RepID=UPI0015E8A23C|nr:serine hydrolase [Bacillus sp. 03113]